MNPAQHGAEEAGVAVHGCADREGGEVESGYQREIGGAVGRWQVGHGSLAVKQF